MLVLLYISENCLIQDVKLKAGVIVLLQPMAGLFHTYLQAINKQLQAKYEAAHNLQVWK